MPGKTAPPRRITKFTNCRIVKGSELVKEDLWIDSLSGKILKDQEAFYDFHLSPDEVIDLGGRIVAPGLIDVQLNGAQGFDFSVPQATTEEYDRGLRMVNKGLARMGVTSYLPTVVSSTPEVYWKVCLRKALPGLKILGLTSPLLAIGSTLVRPHRKRSPASRWRRVTGRSRGRAVHQPRPQRHTQIRSASRSPQPRRHSGMLRLE